MSPYVADYDGYQENSWWQYTDIRDFQLLIGWGLYLYDFGVWEDGEYLVTPATWNPAEKGILNTAYLSGVQYEALIDQLGEAGAPLIWVQIVG